MKLPIDFDRHPLVPAVIQDDVTRDVLMVGFMNRLAFEQTVETGFVHFWSRSRSQLWNKGATSGHTQEVVSMSINCEENSLLIQVIQRGAVCHTGHTSCYYRQILPDGALFETSDPVFDPDVVYGSARSEIALWRGAYRFLRDHDLVDVSSTSRMLRSGALPPFHRIADELEELAGAISREHRHSDLTSDLLLEGSQVLYWSEICALLADVELPVDETLRAPEESITDKVAVEALRDAARRWRASDIPAVTQCLAQTLRLVALAVASQGIEPMQLIARDLDELRTRAYLSDYFASASA